MKITGYISLLIGIVILIAFIFDFINQDMERTGGFIIGYFFIPAIFIVIGAVLLSKKKTVNK